MSRADEEAIHRLCVLFCNGCGPCGMANCPRQPTGWNEMIRNFIAEVENVPVAPAVSFSITTDFKQFLLDALELMIERMEREQRAHQTDTSL